MRLHAPALRGSRRWCARALLPASLLVAACGTQHTAASAPTALSRALASAPASWQASPPATQPAAAATPGDFGTIPEGLRFTWAGGFTPPAWLPAFIVKAPPAPTGGSVVCGVDPVSGLYTALVRYDPASQAGAITIQIQGFHGAGEYANASAGASPVDVEISPPAPSLTGLSGFGATGATVTVDADLTSGTVQSPLLAGARDAGSISGSWRCA